jgi:glycosyltransferase involved in cell wall biosynthesis
MNILLLTDRFAPDIGGIETHSYLLARHFANSGYKTVVATHTATTATTNYAFQIVRTPSWRQLVHWHRWADVVLENNPSIRLTFPNLWIRRPRVVSLHTWLPKTTTWKGKLKKWWVSQAHTVIAVSEALRVGTFPKAQVIHNPYEDDLFQSKPTDRIGFVYLGRLVSDKGVQVAIDALHQLLQKAQQENMDTRQLQLTIIGEGAERSQLMKQVSSKQLQKNVHFAGALRGEVLVTALQRHAVIVVPSVWAEPFGMVALEGMACGCLPLVTAVGGLPEAIGAAGLCVSKENAKELADGMLRLLQDEQLKIGLKAAAVEHLKQHRAATVADRYLAVLIAATATTQPLTKQPT